MSFTVLAGVVSSGQDIMQELTAAGSGIRTFQERLGFDIGFGVLRLGLAHIGRQQHSLQCMPDQATLEWSCNV